jgi:hypothetical protein
VATVTNAAPVIDASCDCDKCVSRTRDTYDLPGHCSNCGTDFVVRNRKGDQPPLAIECPHCETLRFGWKSR